MITIERDKNNNRPSHRLKVFCMVVATTAGVAERRFPTIVATGLI